jgi:hypothetical protein
MTVGSDDHWEPRLSWFMPRFEYRIAHRCVEQWNARDTRVYIGLCLLGMKVLRPMCVGCIRIAWVETSSTPPFI